MDLNCDLGEGEPGGRTRALLGYVTSINVACGGHAGDPRTMVACARWAKGRKIHLGAHPGLGDRTHQGRRPVAISPDQLELLLLHQISALSRISEVEGVSLHHIKLHGALYHATEANPDLGRHYLRIVRKWWPKAIVFARAGGALVQMGRQLGLSIWEEAFADRGYRSDGTLVDRREKGALLTEPRTVVERVKTLRDRQEIQARDGSWVRMRPQTLCVHSDTPNAVRLARAISALLLGAGHGSMTAKS